MTGSISESEDARWIEEGEGEGEEMRVGRRKITVVCDIAQVQPCLRMA